MQQCSGAIGLSPRVGTLKPHTITTCDTGRRWQARVSQVVSVWVRGCPKPLSPRAHGPMGQWWLPPKDQCGDWGVSLMANKGSSRGEAPPPGTSRGGGVRGGGRDRSMSPWAEGVLTPTDPDTQHLWHPGWPASPSVAAGGGGWFQCSHSRRLLLPLVGFSCLPS